MTNDEFKALKSTVEPLALSAFKRLGNFMELADIKQEAWIAATVAVARFKERPEGAASMKTFVHAAVEMALLALGKKTRRRRSEVSFDAPLNENDDEYSEEPNTLYDLLGDDARQEIEFENEEKCLDLKKRFPKNVMDVIYLRLEGLSYEEIAESLKITVGAAKMVLTRVRKEVQEEAA